MQNIETKWLEDFLALEEWRNFSQAAERRSLSQPAFSRRIRALEQAVGVELFDRTTTPLQLTRHGRLFHSQVRSLLQQLENDLVELSGVTLSGKTRVNITAAHSLALAVLPALIESITQHDDAFVCHVEAIDVDQAVNTLREGKSDFILSFRDEELLQTPFASIKLFDGELVPVCAADAADTPRFTAPYTSAPLLTYSPTSYLGRLVNRRLSSSPELALLPLFVSSMTELLKRMALDGYGIAWLPNYQIGEELRQRRLIQLDLPSIPLEAYVYRMETRLSQSTERFWQALRRMSGRDN